MSDPTEIEHGAARRQLPPDDGRTRLMGIVNVTPDSFWSGGRSDPDDPAAAVEHGMSLVAAGADVLDVGGESTRPGHAKVDPDEQLRRVLRVVEGLRNRTDVPISIDTTRAAVAEAALAAGADWINDTTAFVEDPMLADVVAARGCPVVLMHRFDPPRRNDDSTRGREVVREVAAHLAERMTWARERGVRDEQIVLDPGVGFGTLPEDNVHLQADLGPLRRLGRPLLVGPSRKSFLGWLLDRDVEGRLAGTAACIAWLTVQRVEYVRVHDVAEMRDVIAVIDALRAAADEPATAAPTPEASA